MCDLGIEIPVKAEGRLPYLPNEEYHAIDAISASGLKMMSKSFRLYYVKHALKRKYSSALDVGTALHEAILEPDKFDINTYVNLTANEIETLSAMINNTKVMFDYILTKTENEVSFLVHDDGLDIDRKIRVDAYDPVKGIVYDLKSTRHSTPKAFERDAYELGYHLQAAFYLDTLQLAGHKANHFAFLVTPSVSPFEPFAFVVKKELVEEGRGQYSYYVAGYKEFLDNPNKEVSFIEMGLPYFLQEGK